jgi:DNA processing protein
LGSSQYPQALLELVDPPVLLYVRGEIPHGCPRHALAIVGARACSAYGRSQARLFAGKLARSGIAVVSGLARGVDAAAHQGALECNGWTVGVLGCGIDLVYPPVNRGLYREVGARGALVSEFPLGTTPRKMNFPRRNRIIAALSAGVLVVEARERSGTLITVDHALELGKEIYCLPGAVTSPLSTGTHDLIRQGATLVTRPGEILEVHEGWAAEDETEDPGDLSPEESRVLEALRTSPVGLDDLGRMAGLGPADTSRAVTLLEVAGRIVRAAGGTFQAVR